MKINNLMRTLNIKQYDYDATKRTLIIYESLPVKMLSIIRQCLPGIDFIIK